VTEEPEGVVAVREETPVTDGLITSLVMEPQTPVVVVVVVLETQTWSSTLSTAGVTSQETVVPEVPEP
jgi:hypothetical protein